MGTNGQTGTAVARRADDAVRTVSAFGGEAEAFNTAQRIGKALSQSTVVPSDYQGNLPNVLVAMEYAHRLGASVLAVMQNLDIIHGRPSLRATFLIGTVNASGRFSPIRYRWQGEEGTDTWGCRAVATDRESGEECIGPLVTLQTARDEGWYGKKGSKWQTIPELMLMYRAGAWWTRVYCPELSLGLHTSEEVYDMGPSTEQRVGRAVAALDGPDGTPPVIEGAPVEDEDTSEASSAQLEQLDSLREKARAADLLDSTAEESIQEVLESGDGPMTRGWIRDLSKRLAAAGGDQGSLLDREG